AVRILDQALPLQGETVRDRHAADFDQQALPSFREGLDFQLDHQAPLCALLVYQVVCDSMPAFDRPKRDARGRSPDSSRGSVRRIACPDESGALRAVAPRGRSRSEHDALLAGCPECVVEAAKTGLMQLVPAGEPGTRSTPKPGL